MKWVSKLSLALAGAMLAIASRPVAAYPVIRLGGPDATLTALESESKVEAFLALLANPTPSAEDAALAHHVGRLNALKAMSLGGLGGIGELTACHIDAVNGVALALNDEINSHDAMLLQSESAQDMIAALLGLPMIGIDGLAAVDQLAVSSDPESDLALALEGRLSLSEALAQLQDAEVADESITGDTTNLASSLGGGGGGGGAGLLPYAGGAWYGGAKNWYGGANVGIGLSGIHHAAGNSHKGKHHTATPAVVTGGGTRVFPPAAPGYNGQINSGDTGGTVVPLPSAAWGGLFLIAVLAATRKTRLARAIIA